MGETEESQSQAFLLILRSALTAVFPIKLTGVDHSPASSSPCFYLGHHWCTSLSSSCPPVPPHKLRLNDRKQIISIETQNFLTFGRPPKPICFSIFLTNYR